MKLSQDTQSNKALFVAPCYYRGTSFERIVDSVQYVIEDANLPIDTFVGEAFENNLPGGGLDDERYTLAQANTIPKLLGSISVRNYDKLLFIDFFNPGLEMIRYFSEQRGTDIKLASLLHGGTFVEGDIYGEEWVRRAENLWTSLYERVYVPSEYAKSQLTDELMGKSAVFPWGMDNIANSSSQVEFNDREHDVIFPHRLNKDKGVDALKTVVKTLTDIKFLITTPADIEASPDLSAGLEVYDNVSIVTCNTTEDIHEAMGNSKMVLSCAKQELFGYSVAEAVRLGCIPVVPNNQVYTELYSQDNRYDDLSQCMSMITNLLKHGPSASGKQTIPSFKPLLEDFLSL